MEWSETGYILGTRKHGESNLIVEALTRDHGRVMGLVRGGRGARGRSMLQAGNRVDLTWRARLAEHLGNFSVEADSLRAAEMMADRIALAALNTLNALLRLLPERDPHPLLFDLYEHVWQALPHEAGWPADMVRFEVLLLQELGFGLELDRCVSTGAREQLVYVSPKSGRAVSAAAGEPYRDRLLALPAFLHDDTSFAETPTALADGFRLTAYFLSRDVFAPRGIDPPVSRSELIRLLGDVQSGV